MITENFLTTQQPHSAQMVLEGASLKLEKHFSLTENIKNPFFFGIRFTRQKARNLEIRKRFFIARTSAHSKTGLLSEYKNLGQKLRSAKKGCFDLD